MALNTRRLATAAATGIAGALLIALSVWLLTLWSLPEVAGRPYPLTPSIMASRASLFRDALLLAAPAALPLAVLAWLRGPWPMLALSALMLVAGWYVAAVNMADLFASDYGTTWRSGEAFSELLARDLAAPLLCAVACLAYLGIVLRQERSDR